MSAPRINSATRLREKLLSVNELGYADELFLALDRHWEKLGYHAGAYNSDYDDAVLAGAVAAHVISAHAMARGGADQLAAWNCFIKSAHLLIKLPTAWPPTARVGLALLRADVLSAYARIAAAVGRQQPRGLSAADGSTNGSSSGSSSSSSSNGDGGDSNSNRGKGVGDRGGEAGCRAPGETQAQLDSYTVMTSTALFHDLIVAADQTCGFAELLTALERTQLLEHQAGAILRLASAPASASAAGRQAAAQTATAAAAAADATFAALATEEGVAPGGSPQQAGGTCSSGADPAAAAILAARSFTGFASVLVWPPSNGPVSLERLAPPATGAAAGPLAAAVAAPAAAAGGRSCASSGHGSSSGCVGQGGSSSSSASDGSSSVRPAEREATAAPSPSPAADERAEAFFQSELPRVRSLLSGPCVQLLLAWVWACVQQSVTATPVAGGAQTAAAGSGPAAAAAATAAAAAGAASAAAGGARGAADLLDWRRRRRITQNLTSPPLPLPQPMRQTLRLPRELPVRPLPGDAVLGAEDGSGIDDNRQQLLKQVMQMAVGVINAMQVTVGGGGAPRRRRSGLGSSSPAAAAAAVAASDLAATAPQQPQQPQQLQPQPAAPSTARRNDSGGGSARAATPVAAATLSARHAYSLLLTMLHDFVSVAAPAPPLQGLLSVGSHVLLRLLTELPPRQAAARLPGLWQLLVRLLPVEPEEVMCEAVGRALQLQTQPVGLEGLAALGHAAAQLPQRAAVAAAPAAPQPAVAAAAAATVPAAVAAAAGPSYSLRCALDAGLLPALERALRNPAAWPPPNPSARREGDPQLNDLVHAVFQGSCAVPALLAHGDLADAASLVATLGAAARAVAGMQPLNLLVLIETGMTAVTLLLCVLDQLCAALDAQVAKPTQATSASALASASVRAASAVAMAPSAEGLALIAALGGAPPPGSPAAAQQALLASFALQQWLPVLISMVGHFLRDVLLRQVSAAERKLPDTKALVVTLLRALRPATRVMLAVAAAAGEPSGVEAAAASGRDVASIHAGEAAAAAQQRRMDAWRRVMLQPCASAVQRLVVMMVLLAQQGDGGAAAAVTIPPKLEAAMWDLITAYLAVCGPELELMMLLQPVPPGPVQRAAGGAATAATGGRRDRARADRARRGGSSNSNSSDSTRPAAATPPTQETLVGSLLVIAAQRQGSRHGALLTYLNSAGRAQLLLPSQTAAAAATEGPAAATAPAAAASSGPRAIADATAAAATAAAGDAAAGDVVAAGAEAALQLRRVLLRDPAWQRRYGPPMSWLLSPVEMEVRLRRGGVVPGGGAWCCDGEGWPMVSGGGIGGSSDGGGNSSDAGAAAAQGASGGDDCVLLCGNPDCRSLDGPSALIPPGGGKLCSRCKAVRYCCGACQLAHWREGGHSAACARMAAAVAAAPAGPVADVQAGRRSSQRML
ncbi:hypothetical protein CHLRE_14g618800v5 [Chlamydomonas reinhardtii]|uniref:phytol kinase n=1 Tax=Chlamydomonas reinhardtii TaxID=3055 RepID=A0A2K3CXV7_CHLRE|nr:uncharacterized protein CHLRE_14g618800v5 [Chlamydomonas reinhardtii]PNW73100.1 hypothetical protein CHLRE_14g618800v5 [Chlamydomonas reinhardtii]